MTWPGRSARTGRISAGRLSYERCPRLPRAERPVTRRRPPDQTGGDMPDLTDEEREIVAAVSRFVDEQVRPVVRDLDHADEYPGDLIERMKKMGVFGLVVPESFGGSKVSTPC